jgi:hypothetical protein
MAQIVNDTKYTIYTRDKKIKEDAAAYTNNIIGNAIANKDCVKLEAIRYVLKDLKSQYASAAVRGSSNKKRVNRFYGDAVSMGLQRVEIAFAATNCPAELASIDADKLARRQQEAYAEIDSTLGSELALKEYLIYGLGAAVVLFSIVQSDFDLIQRNPLSVFLAPKNSSMFKVIGEALE